MKRFLAFTFAVYLISLPVGLAYASFAAPFVARLNLAGATAGAAGVNVAAKVTGVTSGGLNVASWISLLIPGANVAKIAVAVTAVGGALASDYLMAKGAAWFAARNLRLGTDGIFEEGQSISGIPDGWTASDFSGTLTWNGTFPSPVGHGVYSDLYAAAAAQTAWQTANSSCTGSAACGSFTSPKPNINYCYTQKKAQAGCGMTAENHYFFYPRGTSNQHSETVWSDVAGTYVEDLLATDYSNGVPAADVLGLAGVEVAAAALDNPNHPVSQNAAAKAAIAAALAGSINAPQLANLEAAAVPNVGDNVLPDPAPNINDLTPAAIAAAVAAALNGLGLSADEIARAIAAAQAAASGGLTQAEAEAAVATALAGAGISDTKVQAAVTAAITAAGLATNDGVETAVKDAVNDETGVTPPIDPTPLIPDKLSLTAVLTAFVAAIQQLPIMQTLNGLTINTSGSSVLSLSFLGASYSYDVGGMTSALNTIGSALLGLTTIFSFVGIFKS